METPKSLQTVARNLLHNGDAEGTLRIVGPMLEENPADLAAWRTAALATLKMGDQKTAFKNLSSVALALAEERNPILAIACAKELEALGGDATSLIKKLSGMYSASCDRLEEAELAPPPLPPGGNIEPWGSEVSSDKVLGKAADAMAMAWGAALTISEKKLTLPYVPLLSELDAEEFERLVGSLVRMSLGEKETVIEQEAIGDAMYIVAEGSVVVNHVSDKGTRLELARLGPGAFFGEMALISSAPRAAEVHSTNNTVLLRADKSELEQLVRHAPKIGDVLIAFCHARMLENLIRVSPVLAPVPPKKRTDLIARFGTDYRKAGETIIEQNTEGPGLFLVISGAVSVFKEIDSESIHIASLGPGDLFGEISLLMRKPSTAKVVAEQNTALLVLTREEFEKATSEFPELLKGAYDIAVEREVKNNSILGQTFEDADELILI